jgi:hypothetical protein
VRLCAADLLLAQRGLSLPYSVQAQQVSAFHDALVLVADQLRSIPWVVLLCSLTQTLRATPAALRKFGSRASRGFARLRDLAEGEGDADGFCKIIDDTLTSDF